MQVKQNVNIHNRFDIHVDNAETGEHKEYTGYNIILNQMWTRLCNGNSYFGNIHFGTGTGTPIATRTALFAHLGTKTAITDEIVKALPLSIIKRKIVLNPEEYVGQSISEVGIAYSSNMPDLVTHAMLKDSEGNPISIVKKSTDIITIFATVFVTFDISNENLLYSGMPNNNNLVNYLLGGSSPVGTFGLLPGEGYGARIANSSTVTWTPDTATKKRKANVTRFGISNGNGHTMGLDFTNVFKLKFPAAGIFAGKDYSGIQLGKGDGIKDTFSLPSKNIKQDSIVIKEDGVVTNAYTKKLEYMLNFSSELEVAVGDLQTIELSPNGKVMLVVSNIAPRINVYDLKGSFWIRRPNLPDSPSTIVYQGSFNYDGSIFMIAIPSAPHISIWDWNGSAWTKNADPVSMPPAGNFACSMASDGKTCAVTGNGGTTVYKRLDLGAVWVKTPNPTSLPANSRKVVFSADGNILAVSSNSSKTISTYDWSGTDWVKRSDPSNLPSVVNGIRISPDGSLLVATCEQTPFLTSWDWSGTDWVKRSDPSDIAIGLGTSIAMSLDGNTICLGGNNSPFIAIYEWSGTAWIRLKNILGLQSTGEVAISTITDTVVSKESELKIYDIKKRNTNIILNAPLATDKLLTAEYTVNGIHKTDQYVIDVSFAIQYGEGV